MQRLLRRTAIAGSVVVALCARSAAGIPVLALMAAAAIVVPLGLALAPPREGERTWAFTTAAWLAPLDVLCGTLGWLAPPGDAVAIGCAAVHLLVCAAAGLHGLTRLARDARARGPLGALAVDVGLLLLPVGGVWLLASRGGFGLMGFHEPVVLFTAAHFHFAGFAAPIVLGASGRLLEGPRALYGVATLTVCAGVPLTAVGIATNHTVEMIAAVTLACGMLVASAFLVLYGARDAWPRSRAAAVLLCVSGATLIGTMALAAAFALTSSAGRGSSLHGIVSLQTMMDLHGGGNALGFALAGLVALTLLDATPRRT